MSRCGAGASVDGKQPAGLSSGGHAEPARSVAPGGTRHSVVSPAPCRAACGQPEGRSADRPTVAS